MKTFRYLLLFICFIVMSGCSIKVDKEVSVSKKLDKNLKNESALSIYKELIIEEALDYCSNKDNLLQHKDSYAQCIFKYKNGAFLTDIKSLKMNVNLTSKTWLESTELKTYDMLEIRYGKDYDVILKLYHDNIIEMVGKCKMMAKGYMNPLNPKFRYCLKFGI